MADPTGAAPSREDGDRDFFDDKDLSDIIIKFDNKKVFAHKVFLAKGSVWFEKAFLGGFSEANKEIVELHDDDNHEAVMAMLRHLYGSSYREQDIWVTDEDVAGYHLSVFMLGDKYDIKSLRDQAAERFIDTLEEDKRVDCLYDETIDAIQKVLGPDAPQLADQSLVKSTTEFVFNNLFLFFHDKHFRKLLGEGVMLKEELAIEFLNDLSDNI